MQTKKQKKVAKTISDLKKIPESRMYWFEEKLDQKIKALKEYLERGNL